MKSAKEVTDFPFLCFAVLNPLFDFFSLLSSVFCGFFFCSTRGMPIQPSVRFNSRVLAGQLMNGQPTQGCRLFYMLSLLVTLQVL